VVVVVYMYINDSSILKISSITWRAAARNEFLSYSLKLVFSYLEFYWLLMDHSILNDWFYYIQLENLSLIKLWRIHHCWWRDAVGLCSDHSSLDHWLIVLYPAEESFTYMRIHHCRWRDAVGLCSALRVFEQGDIFIVPHLLWHGASLFPVSFEGSSLWLASYNTQGRGEDLY
jgi:hypothetical protein